MTSNNNRKTKIPKAPGEDGIINKQLKDGGKVIQYQTIPNEWKLKYHYFPV